MWGSRGLSIGVLLEDLADGVGSGQLGGGLGAGGAEEIDGAGVIAGLAVPAVL